MELLLLLLLFVTIAFAGADDAGDLQWKPLENLPQLDDFTLCLSSVPWCGESRSFMIDFLQLVKRHKLGDLQLRYVNSRREKGMFSGRTLTLYHLGNAYKYMGNFAADHVLASVQLVLTTKPSDAPFKSLNSAQELHRFVDSTDEAILLVDLCGWNLKDERVEDCIQEDYEAEFQLSLSLDKAFDRCSPTEKLLFDPFYRNLSDIAKLNFLTPYRARFGVITTLQVLEDAELQIPRSRQWFLMIRSQDFLKSWRVLDDAGQLQDFLTSSTLLVNEVTKDSKLSNTKPSALLFLQRGSYLQDVRDASRKALNVVREVARHFASLHPTNAGQHNDSVAAEELQVILQPFLQDSVDEHNAEIAKGEASETVDQVPEHEAVFDEVVISNEQDKTEDSQEDETGAGFNFGFFEGSDALQESFTGINGTRPSLVVVCPGRGAYYVYPDEIPLGFSDLVEFLDRVLSGSLQPFARSGPTPATPREPVRPPFVNLDFRQVHSLPHVTEFTFSELVLGIRKKMKPNETSAIDLEVAWNRNTLVIFTQSACGFCKRMELVVHEVYRLLSTSAFRSENDTTDIGEMKGMKRAEVPDFYQMDCTANDCSHILANILEEEEFPSVVLFPARQKTAPFVFTEAPTVRNIFRFFAAHESSYAENVGHSFEGLQPSTIRIDGNKEWQAAVRLAPQVSNNAHSVRIGVGNVLLASDKFSNSSSVFHGSAILIVSVTEEHLMGLIVNKRMEWGQPDNNLLQIVRSAYLGYGGPIYEHPKHFYTLTKVQGLEGFDEVAAGLYVGGPSPTEKIFEQIAAEKLSPFDFAFLAGYCGWSMLQFQEELAAGYWEITLYRQSLFDLAGLKL